MSSNVEGAMALPRAGTPPETVLAPALVRLRDTPPTGLLRAGLWGVLLMAAAGAAWLALARLDIVASAGGKLVPATDLKIVQPAEPGVVQALHVRDGQRVRAGDVLIDLDTTLATADTRSLQAEDARSALDLRRLDAELAGLPLARRADDDPVLFEAVHAAYRANQAALDDAVRQEESALARQRAELAAAREQWSKLQRVAPLAREQAAAFEQLHREGFAGRLMHLDKEREAIEKERDLAAQAQQVQALEAAVLQGQQRLAQLRSTWRQRLQAERVEVQSQRARLAQELAKANHRGERLALRAPYDGVVKDLAVHAPGTVVQPGAVLLSLVPDHEPLHAEVWLKNSDIGFVAAGQPVQVKVAAFPFQKYGLLEGRVVQVAADATEPPPGQTLPGAEHGPVFRTVVALQSQQLTARGESHRLAPGMAVAAEIHQGTRSVLEYLLTPVQRVGQEAARER